MPDFSTLLRKPAGQAKRPAIIPAGDYPGIIAGAPQQLESSQKKTPYLRFPLKLTDWAPDAPESWTQVDENGIATEYSKADLDLSARTFDLDFYLSDNALFMFDEFIRSCGIELDGSKGYEEIIPLLVGQRVLAEVQQQMNQANSRIFNRIGRVSGAAA